MHYIKCTNIRHGINPHPCSFYFLILTQGYLCFVLFLEREERREGGQRREGGRERETSIGSLEWESNLQPRYVPDRGANPQPFGVRDDTPTY